MTSPRARAPPSTTASARGDTLHALAQRYNTTVADLMSWNNLTGTLLAAGNTLTIYTIR